MNQKRDPYIPDAAPGETDPDPNRLCFLEPLPVATHLRRKLGTAAAPDAPRHPATNVAAAARDRADEASLAKPDATHGSHHRATSESAGIATNAAADPAEDDALLEILASVSTNLFLPEQTRKELLARSGDPADPKLDTALWNRAVQLITRFLPCEAADLLEFGQDRADPRVRSLKLRRADSTSWGNHRPFDRLREVIRRQPDLAWLGPDTGCLLVNEDGAPDVHGQILLASWGEADGVHGMLALTFPVPSTTAQRIGPSHAAIQTLQTILRLVYHELEHLSLCQMMARREKALVRINQRQAQQLLGASTHDRLTGLANRNLFQRQIQEMIANSEGSGRHFAVLLFDIDHFRRLNESLGHRCGDELLRQIARSLQQQVQQFIDSQIGRHAHVLARNGVDEFGLLLDHVESLGTVVDLAHRILQPYRTTPRRIGGTDIVTTLSCGIAVFPYDGDDAETLLRHADTALAEVKRRGRDGFRFFTREIDRKVVRHFQIENALHRALENGEFEVFYQPKVDLVSKRIVGAEALLRWNHPEQGRLSPGEFIAIAEDLTLIEAIGEWVWNQACADLLRIDRMFPRQRIEMSVNVSARQLRRADLAQRLFATLEAHGLDAGRMQLELTESALVDDPDTAQDIFERLRAFGIPLAIDDFGTGHASLSQLQRLPIETLKIDRSFVVALEPEHASAKIIRAVLQMARELGLRVVAEGVETEWQARQLRELGCPQGQGYLWSRPVPIDRFIALMSQPVEADSCEPDNPKRA